MTEGKTGRIYSKANVRGFMCIGFHYVGSRRKPAAYAVEEEGTGGKEPESIWHTKAI